MLGGTGMKKYKKYDICQQCDIRNTSMCWSGEGDDCICFEPTDMENEIKCPYCGLIKSRYYLMDKNEIFKCSGCGEISNVKNKIIFTATPSDESIIYRSVQESEGGML
jgi:hypothetical protein